MNTRLIFASLLAIASATASSQALAAPPEPLGAPAAPMADDGATSKSVPNAELVITGTVLASASYAAALGSGLGLTYDHFQRCAFIKRPGCPEDGSYMPMLIPVVGPLISIGYADPDAGLGAAMVAMSAGQLVGLTLIFAGLMDSGPSVDVGGLEVRAAVTPELSGMSLQGSF